MTPDNGPDFSDLDGELGIDLNTLATMSPAEYGRRRQSISDETGIALKYLDMEYARRSARSDADDGEDALPPPLDPWPDKVSGLELLDALRDAFKDHMILPSGGAEICALWTLFTHAHDCFEISPVLGATSPLPECGKTTLLTILGELVPQPLPASNITAAALFRAVDKWGPTVLIDEADTFLSNSDELRGILNSGHNKRNAWVVRTTGEDHEPRRFRTWAPKAVSLIGKLPTTLFGRSLHIKLQRKLATDKIIPLRGDRLDHLRPLHRKAARWAADNASVLAVADPDMPPELYSRMADNWRPLLASADRAGGHWPETARKFAKVAAAAERDETAAAMLLADLKAIFETHKADALHSNTIVMALVEMEDRPWAEWGKNEKPMTKEQMAWVLKTFEISPKQIKIGGTNKRGYELSVLKPLFSRYLPATPLPFAETQGFAGDSARYQEGEKVAGKKPANPQKSANGSGVAPQEPLNGHSADVCPACNGEGCPSCVGLTEWNR